MTLITSRRLFALFTDETNKDATQEAKYFIYGGVIIPFEKWPAIHSAIEAQRKRVKFPSNEPLKFASSCRPKSISVEAFTSLKDEIVQIAIQNDVQFIAYLVPHLIAKKQGTARKIEYGLNTVLQKFQQFLEENNGTGVVFIDRPELPKPYLYLTEVFQKGLKYPDCYRSLPAICCLSITCAGASHASSVIDIILGGFRYCVNSSRESDMIKKFLPRVVRMMWGRVKGGKKQLAERGLVLRPVNMDDKYKKPAEAMIENLVRVAERNTGTA